MGEGELDEVKRGLLRDGFAVLRNVVQKPLLEAAVRAINAELGKGVSEDQMSGFKNGVQFPTLMIRPVISDLFNKSAIKDAARSILGPYHPVGAGQIALRFPGAMCNDLLSFTPLPWAMNAWHIDGLTDEEEKWAKRGTLGNFSCLIGVALRDVRTPFCGNLIVYPGSHRVLEAYLQKDPSALQKLENEGEKGLPQFLPFDPLVQVCLSAGDAVICHYQLAHSVAPNTCPDIRYVVYFRLHSTSHPNGKYRKEVMTNIWLDWEGMRSTIASEASKLPPIDLSKVSLEPRGNAPSTMASSSSSTSQSKPAKTLSLQQIQDLSAQASAAFDKENWAAAREPFQLLSDYKPNDFSHALKAAVSTGLSDADFKEGVEYYHKLNSYAQRLIDLAPDIIAGHCLRVRSLVGSGQYEEALRAFETVKTIAPPSEAMDWANGLIVDCARCVIVALQRLNRSNEIPAALNNLKTVFPALTEPLKQVIWTPETVALMKQAEAMMSKEPKDWKLGQAIFAKLVDLAPDNVMIQLQAAACYTYGGSGDMAVLRLGEKYARVVIDLDSLAIGGYGILARNLVFQNRFAEVPAIVDVVLNCRYEASMIDILVDSFRCLKQAYAKTNQPPSAINAAASRFRAQFPQCAERFNAVLTEPACVIL